VFAARIGETAQRVFRLRNRFKLVVPDNLMVLRDRYLASTRGGKTGGANDFELFYKVGIIFSQHEKPITMSELSHELDVPMSTATRIMDWMVGNEYAQRLPDPDDRRIVRVALSASGLEVYRAINEFIVGRVRRFKRQFSPEECETSLSLLSRVLDALEGET
jgi:DNA-binding MarR family transcriptional regulator